MKRSIALTMLAAGLSVAAAGGVRAQGINAI